MVSVLMARELLIMRDRVGAIPRQTQTGHVAFNQ